ncbi:MAG: M67 family metallopeptidase [Fretibacterium sp.]|nr:M67 family metallopeptidase [Fretibacterium sp.]
MRIILKKKDYEDMVARARAELPNEACGLLAGRDEGGERAIEKVYMLTNTDHSPEHFALSPKEQLDAVRDMRAHGLKLSGNWHSHPESPARPSAEDIRLAFDKNISYLILSLEDKENPRLRAFHIENGSSAPEELFFTD